MMIEGVLNVGVEQISLPLTLSTGQNFRWRKQQVDVNRWIGILNNLYVVELVQDNHQIGYKVLNTDYILKTLNLNANKVTLKKVEANFLDLLNQYFRLDVDINELYKKWSKCDSNFAKLSLNYKGIRLLRQDITENIFSFICSSNNNISRISKMIDSLCTNYGNKLHSFEDEELEDIYSFPNIQLLADDQVEAKLRQLGFGYRAKFISKSAKQILYISNGNTDEWINKLSKLTYLDAKQELISLPGIGAKVADCICLMSLGHTEAIPVDTHVYQITAKYYMPELKKTKSLSTQRYNEIGTFYRDKFKCHAGWAQTVLFCSNLKLKK